MGVAHVAEVGQKRQCGSRPKGNVNQISASAQAQRHSRASDDARIPDDYHDLSDDFPPPDGRSFEAGDQPHYRRKGCCDGCTKLGDESACIRYPAQEGVARPAPPAPHSVAQPGATPRASASRNYACERLTRAALAGDALNCQLRDHQVVLLPPGALPRPGLAPLVPYRATR